MTERENVELRIRQLEVERRSLIGRLGGFGRQRRRLIGRNISLGRERAALMRDIPRVGTITKVVLYDRIAEIDREMEINRARIAEINRNMEIVRLQVSDIGQEIEELRKKIPPPPVKFVHVVLTWNLSYESPKSRKANLFASITLDFDVSEENREDKIKAATEMVRFWVDGKFGPRIGFTDFDFEAPALEEVEVTEESELVEYAWWWGRSETDRQETSEGEVEWDEEIPLEPIFSARPHALTWRLAKPGRKQKRGEG